jgi:tetratricopeptide (TPR) repeat protein
MLRAQKKISKRELKEDTLVTAYVKATQFYDVNRKNVNLALTGIAALIIGLILYSNNRAQNNASAEAQFGQVFGLYDQGQYQLAIDGVPERNIPGLKAIVANFGGSDAGQLARFYLGNSYYQLGKNDEALHAFEDFSPPTDLLAVSRLSGIASCYAAMHDYAKAGEYFEKAATKYPDDIACAENLNSAAYNYALAGEKEKAIGLYTKLKKEYASSSFGRDAERYITKLSL